MGDVPEGSSDEPRRPAHDDTVPAIEPPTDDAGEPSRSSRATAPPAERYRLGVELGRGGMGRVVEAFDLQLGRTVALKEVLPKTAQVQRRFRREVQITARLEHASIVPLYDAGTMPDGRPYYVMRRVSGRPLDEQIRRARDLGERLTLLPAVLAAIDAVAHAHRRGVIHRDLKPANILVGELGETVVIDWGLAKVIGEDDEDGNALIAPSAADSLQTQVGSVFGTPGFMSPEQARGEALGTQSDVYALGATLYHLLAAAPPHAGNSATEVIDRTRTDEVTPLSVSAPGAPPELVAIVGKALAFEASARYATAGKLGEDVRRFLAGQLVAAHNYTPRQKLGRFMRRHRGTLAVATLATVVLAVLAWFGVHRIVSERDAANEARHAAIAGKQEAEDARDRLVERHDALIVTQARARLDSNPTDSMAILKQLAPTSKRIAEARVVGQAAVTRGVAWAMQSIDEVTTMVELSPDARRLLQVSRDGIVRVWDLERHRLIIARPFASDVRAAWVNEGKQLLVTAQTTAPVLFDPSTNTLARLPITEMTGVSVTEHGDRVLFTDRAQHASLLDVATRTVTPLWEGHQVDDSALSSDGSWLALVDKKQTVVLDAKGRELMRREGAATRIVVSRFRTVGVLDRNRMFEGNVDQGIWTEVPLAGLGRHIILDLVYRGRELEIYASNGDVIGWLRASVFTRMHVDQFTYRMVVAGEDVLVVPSLDGKLYFATELFRGSIPQPSIINHLKVATRIGQSRVILVGDGVIVGFDLESQMPRHFPSKVGIAAAFIDDDTLLAWRGGDDEWNWIDIPTGKRTPLHFRMRGFPEVRDVDHATGRVLVRETIAGGSRLTVLYKNTETQELIDEGPNMWGRFVPGDALVFGHGDGRVFAKLGKDPAREFVTLDGDIESTIGLGPLRFASISTTGELVRGDLATSRVERTRVQPGASAFLGADLTGRPILVEDNRLMSWTDHDVVEIARVDKPIERIDPVEGGVVVSLLDHETQFYELRRGGSSRRLFAPASRAPVASADGRMLISAGKAEQLTVIEFPTMVRWDLPVVLTATPLFSISPNSLRVLQASGSSLVVWTLPQPGTDFAAWLDEQTNASKDPNDILVWPWQRPATP